jgi:hypothetical protein
MPSAPITASVRRLWPSPVRTMTPESVRSKRGTVVRRHRYLTWRERQIGTLDVEKLAAGAGCPAVGVDHGISAQALAIAGAHDDTGIRAVEAGHRDAEAHGARLQG